MKIDPRSFTPENRYLIVYEVMFCDYELAPEVRKNFVEVWLSNLKRMAQFEVPPRCDVRFVIYLSDDKVAERSRLQALIDSLEPQFQRRFICVSYTHPVDGYGFTENDHPDLWKNPNKVAPRRDELFARAIQHFALDDYDRIIRGSIDDDDYLFSWQFAQFIQAAELAYEDGKVVGVGLRNEIVAYAGRGEADIVSFSHHMHGNKFYVAAKSDFEKLAKLSPWSIPEQFDKANVARLERAGATLKEVNGGLPGYVYCRWGHNLSLQDKSNYYLKTFEKLQFDSVEQMVNSYESHFTATTDWASIEFEELSLPQATPQCNRFSALSAYVPIEAIDTGSSFFLILKSQEGKTLHTQRIAPSSPIPLSRFFSLTPNSETIFGFIQKRNSDGNREILPGRGRITNVEFLRSLGVAEWGMSRESAPPELVSRLQTALAASSWIQDLSFSAHIDSLIKQLGETAYSFGSDSLVEFALRDASEMSSSVCKHLERLRIAMSGQQQQAATSNSRLPHAPLTAGQNEFSKFPLKLVVDFQPNPGKPLVVVLHGRKAENVRLPYLPGRGITAKLDVAFLSISDPTFYLAPNLSIGWHAGSAAWPSMQQDLAHFIASVADEQNSSKIVFVGGSAGGFASLILSRLIEGSSALIWNPQANILKYYRRFVDEYLKQAWGTENTRAFHPKSLSSAVHFSAIDLYANTPPTNTVVYLQEESDAHHISEHFMPFKNTNTGSAGLYQYVSHWGDGHAPAPKALIVDFLKALTSAEPTNEIAKLGAVPL